MTNYDEEVTSIKQTNEYNCNNKNDGLTILTVEDIEKHINHLVETN